MCTTGCVCVPDGTDRSHSQLAFVNRRLLHLTPSAVILDINQKGRLVITSVAAVAATDVAGLNTHTNECLQLLKAA